MHLADGVVTQLPLIAGVSLLGGAAVAISLRQSADRDPGDIAWVGTLGAFVLAAQAINVPLVAGASAHVIGAGLLALCLGSTRAIVTLSAVLVIQALLLADGGVTVLGINLLNLAVVPVIAMSLVRRVIGIRGWRLAVTAVVGTCLGHLVGATSLASVLVLGAGAPPSLTFGWLLTTQGIAGLLEGALTAVAARSLLDQAPALLSLRGPTRLDSDAPRSRRGLGWTAVAIGIALTLLPLASTRPDALEHLLERLR